MRTDLRSTTDRVTAADLGTVLTLVAHPDDETYLAAGVMAAASALGQRVVSASASAGELGTDDPQGWPPHRLAAVRRLESAAAMAVLGVREHHVGTLPDGGLDRHTAEGEAWVGGLIDAVQPDTILTFGPDGATGHPDHVAVHRWVTEAWEQRLCAARLLYATTTAEHLDEFGEQYEAWGVYMTDERPSGVPARELALHLVLDGPALDRKLVALRAMATQTSGIVSQLELPGYARLVAEEAFVDARVGQRRPAKYFL
jgi:LmbE family N-acetylglucosaminyl deacetylase